MTPAIDYATLAVDPDTYPRSIRLDIKVLENGDIILEAPLDPDRLNMTEGDHYEVVLVCGTVVLKKILINNLIWKTVALINSSNYLKP